MQNTKLVVALIVLGLLGLSDISYSQEGKPTEKAKTEKQSAAQQKDVYTCPMHPEVTSDKPGKCLKCGMNLEKKESKAAKVKAGMDMEMDSMCADMCMMMMNDLAMMKMMHECMMGEMKEMKEKPDDAMRMKEMEKMKSCCEMMKNK